MISELDLEINKDLLKKRAYSYTKGMPCVFLKNNECSIYDHRPIKCMTYMVTTPNDNCIEGRRVRAIKNDKVKRLIDKAFDTYGKVIFHRSLYNIMEEKWQLN